MPSDEDRDRCVPPRHPSALPPQCLNTRPRPQHLRPQRALKSVPNTSLMRPHVVNLQMAQYATALTVTAATAYSSPRNRTSIYHVHASVRISTLHVYLCRWNLHTLLRALCKTLAVTSRTSMGCKRACICTLRSTSPYCAIPVNMPIFWHVRQQQQHQLQHKRAQHEVLEVDEAVVSVYLGSTVVVSRACVIRTWLGPNSPQ
jgi:hypothetical protein